MNKSDNTALKYILKKIKTVYTSDLDKAIGFYKTILELERKKEPNIDAFYPYDLHFMNDDSAIILIDMPCNANFTKSFLENKALASPKDLFVGLPIIHTDKQVQIVTFGVTIDHDDLKEFDPYQQLLPIKISSLTLDTRHIDELGLTVEDIDEIENDITQIKSVTDLQQLVKKHFGEATELKLELQLALSSKNIALSQISAELNKLSVEMVKKNDLLEHFLLHTEFNNLIQNISVDNLIPIGTLDDSQANAVAHALSNRFSVITGAPGTGKTQVILNIIANALMMDKSVLVASKINRAVDNVKERFDLIDLSQYLIRFGKKETIRNQTIPALNYILGRLNSLQGQPRTLETLLAQYKTALVTIENAKKKLARIEELEKVVIPKLVAEISSLQGQIANETQRHNATLQTIRNKYSYVSQFENLSENEIDIIRRKLLTLKMMKDDYECKYDDGFWSGWHNLFSKKKDAKKFLNQVENIPSSVKTFLQKEGLVNSITKYRNGKIIVEEASEVIAWLDKISNFIFEKTEEDNAHSENMSNLTTTKSNRDQQYKTLDTELNGLNAQSNELSNSISRSKALLVGLGPQLIGAKIIEIERENGAAQKISSYKSYLPDSIPPRTDNEMPAFIQKSREFLSVCRLISVTSLSVKTGFPMADNLFDILIIDEASQCDVASALPLILRAKQVVVIGDPKQLKHITSVKANEEKIVREHLGLSNQPYLKYVEQSLWDYSEDFLTHANQNSSTIMLENHYRCHRDIIDFSNQIFYGPSHKQLKIRTNECNMTLPQRGMVMINIHGQQESANVNINRVEAAKCIAIAKEICSLKAGVSIGIVTPFRNQADYIKSMLDDSLKDVTVSTVYGFQGDEKDVMIYSLVVTDNSPISKIKWINSNPNIVNVAVTRARQTLYIVGNADYIKSVSSETKSVSPESNVLDYLIRYAQSKNK